MAGNKPAVSFDQIIQEGRKKKQAERLAAEIFGGRKSTASPVPKNLGGSLASRVGVNKRNSSLPRPNSAQQQGPSATAGARRPRPSHLKSADAVPAERSRAPPADEINGGDGLYIRGAARTTSTVVASNFAPDTTAADIEIVMESVGGAMTRCMLVSTHPIVVAEMDFQDKAGADKVVETFNGKKADGRTLRVHLKATGGAKATAQVAARPAAPTASDDVTMDIDDNAESRKAQDRLREERRGRDERPAYPTGPRNAQEEYYDRRPRQPQPRDQRYGYGGGDRFGGNGGGRYYDDSRRFDGGQYR